MPSYRRPEGAEGAHHRADAGREDRHRRRTTANPGTRSDQPGAPSERRPIVAAARQRGVGPRRGVATRTQASRSVAGSTTRSRPGPTPRPRAGCRRERLPGRGSRQRLGSGSPGQVRSAAVGSAASAGGVDKVRARIRGEAPGTRRRSSARSRPAGGKADRDLADRVRRTIDTVAVSARAGWVLATGAVLAPAPAGAAPAWAAPAGAAPAAARSASPQVRDRERRDRRAAGHGRVEQADRGHAASDGARVAGEPEDHHGRPGWSREPDRECAPGARLAASGSAISWAAAPDAVRGRLHASTRVGVPSAAPPDDRLPDIANVPTSPPAGGPDAAGCANATGVVKRRSWPGPLWRPRAAGPRRPRFALSVAATTARPANESVAHRSEAGATRPSHAPRCPAPGPRKARRGHRQVTICPARVALATSDHAAATGAAGALESPSARATGVHRTANRIASGRPSVRVVHGSATTIREPTRTGALADGATSVGPRTGGRARGASRSGSRSRSRARRSCRPRAGPRHRSGSRRGASGSRATSARPATGRTS